MTVQNRDVTYSGTIKNWSFTWRRLTRKEYMPLALRQMMGEDISLDILQIALLQPDPSTINFDTMPAGVVEQLVGIIWEQSAPPSTEKLLETIEEARALMNTFEMQAENTICTAFPSITPEETKDWPYSKLIEYAARAEWVLRNIYSLPLEIGGTEKQQQKKPEELRKEGIDPMSTLTPEKLLPKQLPDMIIVGTKGWRSFNIVDPVESATGAGQ